MQSASCTMVNRDEKYVLNQTQIFVSSPVVQGDMVTASTTDNHPRILAESRHKNPSARPSPLNSGFPKFSSGFYPILLRFSSRFSYGFSPFLIRFSLQKFLTADGGVAGRPLDRRPIDRFPRTERTKRNRGLEAARGTNIILKIRPRDSGWLHWLDF